MRARTQQREAIEQASAIASTAEMEQGAPRPVDEHPTSADEAELDRIVRNELLRPVFQPIVDIDRGVIFGYEALTRGPQGSPLERPDRLFATAAAVGRTVELDWACRHTALAVVDQIGMPGSTYLSLNAEPTALTTSPPPATARLLAGVAARTPIVIEITERDVTADPAMLIRTVNWVRRQGFRIAVDDVGIDPHVLALLPLLAPEIIKLDLHLVHDEPDADVAAIIAAVNAQAERTGAAIVAEGVETERHRFVARSFGATLGQGWLFGRPGALPADGRPATVAPEPPQSRPQYRAVPTPFDIGRGRTVPRIGSKDLLLEMSKHLEQFAGGAGASCMVLSAFQEARYFTPATRVRYRDLAQRVAFVAALGAGMPRRPMADVRGTELHADDPIREEWDVVVLGAGTAAALVARDLGDHGPESRRRFEFVTTYDVDVVADMAGALLSRIAAQP